MLKKSADKMREQTRCIQFSLYASVKAVHLEVVLELLTDAFLATLDRFVARRGNITDIILDCGTYFVGLMSYSVILKCKSPLMRVSLVNGTSIHLHFGGLQGATIKSTKHHLKHVIEKQILTYEEMQTFITCIEGILDHSPISRQTLMICVLSHRSFF